MNINKTSFEVRQNFLKWFVQILNRMLHKILTNFVLTVKNVTYNARVHDCMFKMHQNIYDNH